MARVSPGQGLFIKHVKPYLKKWLRKADGSAPPARGVYDAKVWDMPGIGVHKNFKYTKRTTAQTDALRKSFKPHRQKFLKGLDPADLRAHGFTPADITRIGEGKLPKGYEVHHKFPLDDSGTHATDNLVLIHKLPDHQLHTNHQTYTVGDLVPNQTRVVDWPTFPDGTSIWPPSGGGARHRPDLT